MRHVLAIAVLIEHAFVLSGSESLLAATRFKFSLGGAAVAGFFVLSGALITASWEHSPTAWQFARNRLLRIFPGYLACLLVTAFVIGPLALAAQSASGLATYWRQEPSPLGYVLRNGLLMQFQNRIGSLFAASAEAYSVNGSLWSIPWEAGCYAMVAALGVAGVLKRCPLVVAAGVGQAGPWGLLLASLAATVLLAALSWHWVESKCLRLKRAGNRPTAALPSASEAPAHS